VLYEHINVDVTHSDMLHIFIR